ncbi:MAG: DUF411 domain-containing protein [Gemmatimonadales bacterium]
MITRRAFVAQTAGLAIASLGAGSLLGETTGSPTVITVYKSASCTCCAKWVDHLRANGFAPTVHDEEDMDRIKDEMAVPSDMRSCHTARLDRYVIEGHVPAADLRRLLKERPSVSGLAAPGMPASGPGMAVAGQPLEPYEVFAFTRGDKTTTFARH